MYISQREGKVRYISSRYLEYILLLQTGMHDFAISKQKEDCSGIPCLVINIARESFFDFPIPVPNTSRLFGLIFKIYRSNPELWE